MTSSTTSAACISGQTEAATRSNRSPNWTACLGKPKVVITFHKEPGAPYSRGTRAANSRDHQQSMSVPLARHSQRRPTRCRQREHRNGPGRKNQEFAGNGPRITGMPGTTLAAGHSKQVRKLTVAELEFRPSDLDGVGGLVTAGPQRSAIAPAADVTAPADEPVSTRISHAFTTRIATIGARSAATGALTAAAGDLTRASARRYADQEAINTARWRRGRIGTPAGRPADTQHNGPTPLPARARHRTAHRKGDRPTVPWRRRAILAVCRRSAAGQPRRRPLPHHRRPALGSATLWIPVRKVLTTSGMASRSPGTRGNPWSCFSDIQLRSFS